MPRGDEWEELRSLIDKSLESLFLEDDEFKIISLAECLDELCLVEEVEQTEIAEYIATSVQDYFTGKKGFIPNAQQDLAAKKKEIVQGLELHRKYILARELIDTLKLVKKTGTEETAFQEELITIDPIQIYSLHLEALIHLFNELASSRGKTDDKAMRRVLSYGVAMLIGIIKSSYKLIE